MQDTHSNESQGRPKFDATSSEGLVQTNKMEGSLSRPYSQLTPDLVLDALDAVCLRGDGRLLQLNSYENRVFQIHLEQALRKAVPTGRIDDTVPRYGEEITTTLGPFCVNPIEAEFEANEQVVVAKFYRPQRWSNEQILEEHRFAAELMAEEIPACAPLALQLGDAPVHGRFKAELCGGPTLAQIELDQDTCYRFSVTPRQAGRAPELEDPHILEWIGRFIGRMHCVGARSLFQHRRTLSVQTLGQPAQDWLLSSDRIPPEVLPAWQNAADQALVAAQAVFDQHPDIRTLRLHGDCHVGNLLWTEAGPHFVDLDDACNGPAIQDLWMLLSSDASTAQRQTRALLQGYETFMPFDDRELALIEPLRMLRMIHHSAWLAQRWSDPAFPAGFPWFGTAAYWQQQVADLREAAASSGLLHPTFERGPTQLPSHHP
jgi:Ser/Thr protein kinase RdoA (MazF antagonist)